MAKGIFAPLFLLCLGVSVLSGGCALSPAVRARYEGDLLFARSIRLREASPLHRQFFGESALDGGAYVGFIRDRASSVGGEGILFANCHGAMACYTGGGVLRLTTKYDDPGIPAIARLSYLVHEARHSEGYVHDRCEGPARAPYSDRSLQGEAACDSTVLGAYGVQIVLLENVARFCESCTGSTREAARKLARSLISLIENPAEREIIVRDSLTSR